MELDYLELEAIDMKQPEDNIIKEFIAQMETLGFVYIKNVDGFDMCKPS